MVLSKCHVILSLLCCFLLLQEPTQAIKQTYIVYLGSHSFGRNPSSVDAEYGTKSHYDLLGSYLGSVEKAKEAIIYSYNRYINGFAAILDEKEAAQIAKHPKVISVFLNRQHKLHTTHSWSFQGLAGNGVIPESSVWKKSLGEDVIIGNFDTGVWPESKSFSDEGMGPVPQRWHGICQTNDKVQCNKKLIGARYFNQGSLSISDEPKEPKVSYSSVRDYDGHGSHTLSTAGGNFVPGASVYGYGNGTASGGSPKAHVAAYKVCFDGSCADADILAAYEAAIGDGVDVLSVSIGLDQPFEFLQMGSSIGSFHAVAHGIVVVTSGGNIGPNLTTVSNVEPWVITVGASTTDRVFDSDVILGDQRTLKGQSLSQAALPSNKMFPLINATDAVASNSTSDDAFHCLPGSLDPNKAKGKILLCMRGGGARTAKGIEAARVGAAGMILANDHDSGNDIIADPHVLPATQVNYIDGTTILDYIKNTKSPVASISAVKTELGVQPAPVMASFSSRGPSALEPAILKPDITAPGVSIIAAYSLDASPADDTADKRRIPFFALGGSSMACPHVSGVVGLLKSIHPGWSPAAIKSAIMTTATAIDNTGKPILDSFNMEAATPFAYGAGHVQPNSAADPGLVYDLETTDYLNVLCSRGYNSSSIEAFYGKPYTCPNSFNIADFNYPSITINQFDDGHCQNVTRTVTNVGPPGTYTVKIEAPPEVTISVEPNTLNFCKIGEKKVFTVSFALKPQNDDKANYFFGSLDWTDGKHHVRSPIVIKNA